ncbi:hypothetical protein M422DRAFT_49170 [Sphaerobolus stellatus SS14]|uniref:Piwi domain-containing protein n=1 Tax=Sphaerobolus stellatus (strain SS14) TaxID=990650 RepID=A0A0C9VRA8_SPHS4|nr:hypothetical protein M422DRAFT_49170 [Sphaerobolus stellatus SS14]
MAALVDSHVPSATVTLRSHYPFTLKVWKNHPLNPTYKTGTNRGVFQGAASRGCGGGGGDGDRGGGGGFRGGGRSGPRGGGLICGFFTINFKGTYHFDTPAKFEPRVKQEGDVLVNKLKNSTLSGGEGLKPPMRPGYGTKGTEISVRENYFALKVPKGPLYEYKIYYEPGVTLKRMRKRLLQILEDAPEFASYKNIVAHDFSEKLIAGEPLPQPKNNPLGFNVKLFDADDVGPDERSKSYKIMIQFANEINMTNINAYLNGSDRSFEVAPLISALNTILAKAPMGQGVKGFHSSVRPTVNSLMVNINVCYTAFYKTGKLADTINTFLRESHGGRPGKFVEGIRISPTHLSYRPKKTVKKLLRETADKGSFQCPEYGGKITVADYFKRSPMVGHRRWDQGENQLAPCSSLGKLSECHTAEMIKFACNPPADNARSIVGQGLGAVGFNGTQSLTNFGLELTNWGVFAVISSNRDFQGPTDPELIDLVNTFRMGCTAAGMPTAAPTLIHGAQVNPDAPSNLSNALKYLVDRKGIFNYMEDYDVELGVHATCAVSAKIRKEKGQLQYMTNLSLKINPKLGGTNHVLDPQSGAWLKKKVTMLVGMGVTHPGPGSAKGTPSIADVVTSYDVDHMLYPTSLCLQTSKQENIQMIEDLAIMM